MSPTRLAVIVRQLSLTVQKKPRKASTLLLITVANLSKAVLHNCRNGAVRATIHRPISFAGGMVETRVPAGDRLKASGQIPASHFMSANMQTVATEEASANFEKAPDSVSPRELYQFMTGSL